MSELTKFFKLLSDETRLRILLLLKSQRLCVCELCGIMNESQPKVSKHLAKLRDLGIIDDERHEQFIFYSLKTNNKLYLRILDDILDSINDYPIVKEDIEKSENAERFIKIS